MEAVDRSVLESEALTRAPGDRAGARDRRGEEAPQEGADRRHPSKKRACSARRSRHLQTRSRPDAAGRARGGRGGASAAGFWTFFPTATASCEPGDTSLRRRTYTSRCRRSAAFRLKRGDEVRGQIRPPKDSEKYNALLRIESVNGDEPEVAQKPDSSSRR